MSILFVLRINEVWKLAFQKGYKVYLSKLITQIQNVFDNNPLIRLYMITVYIVAYILELIFCDDVWYASVVWHIL